LWRRRPPGVTTTIDLADRLIRDANATPSALLPMWHEYHP